MPIPAANNQIPDSTAVTDGTGAPGEGGTYSTWLEELMQLPGFPGWMALMLRNLGYGVQNPGETTPAPPATTTDSNAIAADTAQTNLAADPFGANWSPGMKLSDIDWTQRQVTKPRDRAQAAPTVLS